VKSPGELGTIVDAARASNALRVVGALATAMQRTAADRQIGSVY